MTFLNRVSKIPRLPRAGGKMTVIITPDPARIRKNRAARRQAGKTGKPQEVPPQLRREVQLMFARSVADFRQCREKAVFDTLLAKLLLVVDTYQVQRIGVKLVKESRTGQALAALLQQLRPQVQLDWVGQLAGQGNSAQQLLLVAPVGD